MGKLILCSGSRTKKPYGFTSTGIRVYSMEELCYYLYNHVYLIDEDIFCDSLFEWIDTELKFTERAEKLRALNKQKADLKTMVTVTMCSTDYYTEYEIKGMLKILDEIMGMPMIKRSFAKANNYLKNNQYHEAFAEYELMLNEQEMMDLSPEEYGDVLHNMAVAKVHITGIKEAAGLFRQAYERNHREESLRQFLYSLLLSNHYELFQEKVEDDQISEELTNDIMSFMEQIREIAKASELMKTIQHLKNRKEHGDTDESNRKIDEMIGQWKNEIRKI